jgi:hypothetical protein
MDTELFKFPGGEKLKPEDLKTLDTFLTITQSSDGQIRFRCRGLNLRFLLIAKRLLGKFEDDLVGFKELSPETKKE